MVEILYLADSRGFSNDTHLTRMLSGKDTVKVHCIFTPGGNIKDVVQEGIRQTGRKKFNQIYVQAGINNLTCKLGNREVTPIFNSWSLLIRHLMIEYHEARALLYQLSDTVIICELVGLHFGLYNLSGAQYLPQQLILNRGVMRANEYIADMNRQVKVFSPYFAGLTHKMKGTTEVYHRYALTTYDGLHFN